MRQVSLNANIISKRLLYGVSALLVALGVIIVPSLASADALAERSIQPSSASISAAATSVQYTVRFTAETAAGAVVVLFCDNSPVVTEDCDAPTGMSVAGAAAGTGVTSVASATANRINATATVSDTGETSLNFTGLTNPTVAGTIYARILTFVDGTAAGAYVVGTNPPAIIDSGAVAMYFDESVNVYGTVLETLSFCVSGAAIAADCTGVVAPNVRLGEEVTTGVYALNSGALSTGTLHTQISTNAASGAVVRLKSSASCGGLMLAGTSTCPIEAALGTTVAAGEAKFGVRTGTAVDAAGGALVGTLRPYANPTAFYDNTNYKFNYSSTNPTTEGVTSTWGDPFLDTNNEPATNVNMPLTFAASVTSQTPAGLYSTDLSMIAVGKF